MAQKVEIRRSVFGTPVPNFTGGGMPTEVDIFRVFMWCEKNSENPSSPVSVLDDVTKLLREHWKTIGKVVQGFKEVKQKVSYVVKKAQKLDNCTHILTSPEKYLPTKKSLFRRVVDIELKNRTNQGVVKVRECLR